MNKRVRKKKAKNNIYKFAKELKKTIPGIKIIYIKAYPNGDFYSNFKYKDMIIHYNSLYSPKKVLFEFEELVDKWTDWRVYHSIEIDKDLKEISKEVKKVLDDIYSNYTNHYVNSLKRRYFIDIDKLETELNSYPKEYYNEHIKEKQNLRFEKLKEHQENLKYLKGLNNTIRRIDVKDDYYTITFSKELSQEEADTFFKEGSKIAGFLDYEYYYY